MPRQRRFQERERPKRNRRRRGRRNRQKTRGGGGAGITPNPPSVTTSGSRSGQSIGSQIGATLGNFAQKGLTSLFGFGDYDEVQQAAIADTVGQNSLLKPEESDAVPLLNSLDLKDGHIRVKHREFLGDVITQTSFSPIGFRLNPTEPTVFPWLSSMASNFQQWIPHGIVFEFISTSGDSVGTPNTALGTISMATVFDADNVAPFTTKVELLNTVNAVSGKPSVNIMHGVECDPDETVQRVLFTDRKVSAGAGDNGRSWYQLGVFVVGTSGAQVPAPGFDAGELWITYDISLLKPKLPEVAPLLKDYNWDACDAWMQRRAKEVAKEQHREVRLADLQLTPELRQEFVEYCESLGPPALEQKGEDEVDLRDVQEIDIDEDSFPPSPPVLVRSQALNIPHALNPSLLRRWTQGQ